MLSVSPPMGSGRAASYYKHEEYYTKTEGTWFGKGAETMGLIGDIEHKDWVNIINGQDLRGNQIIENGRNAKGEPEHRAGIDLTFSAPKSVSIMGIFDERLLEAYNTAVTRTLEYIEKNYATARQTIDGNTFDVKTGNMVVGMFEHMTSRELDTQIHTHAFLANMTLRPDGNWRAMHYDPIYAKGMKMFMGQFYRNELAVEVKELGYAVNSDFKGLFDLKGVDNELKDHFSKRHDQIIEKVDELRKIYPDANESKLKEMACLGTRAAKEEVDLEFLKKDWISKMGELGYTKESLLEATRSASLSPEIIRNKDYIRFASEIVTQRESTFSKEEVLLAAGKISVGFKTILSLEDSFKESIKQGHIIDLKDNAYTTREMLNIERNIVELATKGISTFNPLRNNADILVNDKYSNLTDSQKRGMALILSTKDSIIAIQGDAGTGKTTMLKALNNEIGKDLNIRGFSFTGKATSALEATGIKSSTIHSFLGTVNLSKGNELWLIDESSMVGSRQLNDILMRAQEFNARVVMIGDTKQLQAIDAGNMFSQMQKRDIISTEKMNDIVRQKDSSYLNIVKDIANKDIDGAFLRLDISGKIVTDKIDNLKEALVNYACGKDDVLIIATRNKDRHEINDEIRNRYIDQGKLITGYEFQVKESKPISGISQQFTQAYQAGDIITTNGPVKGISKGQEAKVLSVDETAHMISVELLKGKDKGAQKDIDVFKDGEKLGIYTERKIELAQGDKVVLLKNSNSLEIKNGQLGRIDKIDSYGQVMIDVEGSKKSFNINDKYNYLDHGYSITDYKSQGSTVKEVIVYAPVSDEKTHNYNSLYVSVTRGEHDVRIFTNDKDGLIKQVKNEIIKKSTLDHPESFYSKDNDKTIDRSPSHNSEQTSSSSRASSLNITQDRGTDISL